MSPWRITSAFVLVFGAALSSSAPVRAEPVRRVVVDRIIAVVDREVISLVELRRRAAPFLLQLASVDEAKRPYAEAQMHRQIVDDLIEERLIARRARMASTVVTASEIDAAIDAVAQANQLTRERLLAEARASGLPEADYRDELRRQLLAQKCLRAYLASKGGGAGMTEAQLAEARRSMIEEMRRDVYIEVRL